MADELQIVVTEQDVRTVGGDRLIDELKGVQRDALLGASDDTMDKLMEVLPRVISKKLKAIIPVDEYDIVDITLSFKLSGTVGVVALDGNVQVKIRPRR